jgi:hypothetical protein
MRKLQATKNISIQFLIIVFTIISFSYVYSQDSDVAKKHTKLNYDLVMSNFEKNLNSENHGVRMCTIENIGRYKMANFENDLIELLKNEQNIEDKKIIALSLFQLGSFDSILELKNSVINSNNNEYKEYCTNLFNKNVELDKLRSEYFENLLVYTKN